MPTLRSLLASSLSTVVLASLAAGCASDTDGEEPVTAVNGRIAGTRLAEIAVDDATTVGFYELAPGIVAMRESAALDRASDRAFHSPIDRIGRKATLAETYRALAPGKDVPAAILEADARAAEMAPKLAALGAAAPAADPAGGALPGARTGDLTGDNYSANWFLDNFCREGGSRFCPTNYAWAYSGRSSNNWFKTCAMAADFEASVQFKGGHQFSICNIFGANCDWYTQMDWDYELRARHVECWVYNTQNQGLESWATGLAPSPRLHFSALR